ncbi:MAG: glycosyltransferase [Cyanobacteria bacterium Co-bin8]|nr:glycosyltransferase [Cyanobacteria bacterium Co-bin8]
MTSFSFTPLNSLALLLSAVALLVLVPTGVLFLECLAAFFWRGAKQGAEVTLPTEVKLAVLIPAHNEATGIGQTLEAVKPQLRSQDRLIVIADNCTDDTTAVARSYGATVIERFNTQNRGKGYALDFGLNHLKAEPPQVVIFLDADCDAHPGSIAALTQQALKTGYPVQATYLMEKPHDPGLKDSISAFAFKVKNLVRPLGLRQLQQPCLLTGTGMAMPWAAATAVSIASGHIVEDMKLGLDLAIAGYPPQFCPEAWVTSRLPQGEAAAKSQRTRWEHGHLQVMSEFVPKLLLQFLRQGRLGLLALALELSVLPLSLLVMLWAGLLVVTAIFTGVTGLLLPLTPAALAGACLFLAIGLAWQRYGRSEISLKQLVQIPLYILWKIPLYIGYVVRPEKRWIRTERDT